MNAAAPADTSEQYERWDRRSRPVIALAAIAPLVIAAIDGRIAEGGLTAIDTISWAILLVDLIVRTRLRPGYLRSGNGTLDLAIVVLTFPWTVLGIAGASRFVAIFRVARLVRLLVAVRAGSALERLAQRMGRLALIVAISAPAAAAVVVHVEPPSSHFKNFGDGLWWALVTITTVGYGDLYPVTPAGRLAAIVLMIVGLGALGTISAGLASLFADESNQNAESSNSELAALRQQVDRLEQLLERSLGAAHADAGTDQAAPASTGGKSADGGAPPSAEP